MSELNIPSKVIFFMSCLYDEAYEKKLHEILLANFGNYSTFYHDYFPMKEYYSKEMGADLKRVFVFFSEPIEMNSLVDLKIKCDQLEREYRYSEARSINLDPGYISPSQVILSSGKPYNHRVYLDRGVYAELCYQFERKSFNILPWTYPDYSHPEIIQAFNITRELNFFHKTL